MATKRATKSRGGTTTHGTWSDIRASWRRAKEELLGRFRPLYLVELERFAETLRPRFEAGELYGYRDDEAGREQLDGAIEAHFGLEVPDGDEATAHLILAVSPSASDEELADNIQSSDWSHVACAAREAVLCDVLGVARARGWYTADAGEAPAFDLSRWARRYIEYVATGEVRP